MGDLLGAAASYLMIVLILMLMGQFIVQIGRMKRETLMGFGRVALYTGLFALAKYGLMMFFRRAATGAGKMITFADIVDQRVFSHIFSPILERFGIPEKEREYTMRFYLTGITAMVMEWIKNDCRESDEEICRIIVHCVDGRNM